jgi:actin-related protein 5
MFDINVPAMTFPKLPNAKQNKEADAIVIDNGSYVLRAGYNNEANGPSIQMLNSYMKKSSIGTPFEANTNVVINGMMFETMLETVFTSLPTLKPVYMTEAVLNPTRYLSNEILFELFNVPSVGYGIDSLFSAYYNDFSFCDERSLIISSSNTNTMFINGKLKEMTRISLGGSHMSDFMLKSLFLKYPTFPFKMSQSQATSILHHHCYFAEEDYLDELRKYERFDFDNQIQVGIHRDVVEYSFEKQQEELKRKEEASDRMKEQAARQRLEKLRDMEEQLSSLMSLKDLRSESLFREELAAYNLQNEAELDSKIIEVQKKVSAIRMKIDGVEYQEEKKPPPPSDLLLIPDSQLTEEQKKEKKKQRLLKAGYDAREKIRKERLEEQRQRDLKAAEEEKRRLADPEAWIVEMRQIRLDLLKSIEKKKKRSQDKRSQNNIARAKAISSLASEDKTTPKKKKRKKGEDDDNFGIEDKDWDIYAKIVIFF